ncbi:hypothetical protein L6164_031054 [Bauhinia variegata]|uniref:Uncharacterized protein n=1 Tax=Bauhinia variegata TaxID=167791 RepID=A0ACB9LE95_BAUVA|nr:hypothetical protein L6164_031054 [Bauhinia variegata]
MGLGAFLAMLNYRHFYYVFSLLLLPLQSLLAQGAASNTWLTLTGNPPLVIARGGFSGLFPDSSSAAYNSAVLNSAADTVLWCNVQLTRDGAGICLPDLNLKNSTNIARVVRKTVPGYWINGVPSFGHFTVDYTLNELSNASLTQGIYSRTEKFDGDLFPILKVEDVFEIVKPSSLWLNIQYDAFFQFKNLSMRNFVLSVSKRVNVSYISSPEVDFLTSIKENVNPRTTKLVFRFLEQDKCEPSTRQSYGSLLKNPTFIKTFASGILVPKSYIWPVDSNLYLQPHTSLVLDAHKEGLQVFASDFASDAPLSYNYSYDPLAECLSFIDNGDFSVDGLLSDFPITPSMARDCFAHGGKNTKREEKPLVISKCGASGDYPACSDLAYKKAISDGVDVLDCPVQMSKDGVPFCFSSINLNDSTTVAQSSFSRLRKVIPEIMSDSGIFTFMLTWNEIKTLTPSISIPYKRYRLFRNPKFKNEGTSLTLSEFLAMTKTQTSLSGVLISIEMSPSTPLTSIHSEIANMYLSSYHVDYLAKHEGLSVSDAVLDALSKAGYDNQDSQKVMIQSTKSSVLMKFKEKGKFELIYKVDKAISDALDSAVENITKFADSVVIQKNCVFPTNKALFLIGSPNVVPKLKSFNLSVYVGTFSNEFVSQAWDYFSDATVEINAFVMEAKVDGIITDFPRTAARYKEKQCLNLGKDIPEYMTPVMPGGLAGLISTRFLPPAEPTLPVLTVSDVWEAPPPSVPSTGEFAKTTYNSLRAKLKATLNLFWF